MTSTARLGGLIFILSACGTGDWDPEQRDSAAVDADFRTANEGLLHLSGQYGAAVGLSIFVQNGASTPMKLIRGPRRYMQEVDIVERVAGEVDAGITPLFTAAGTQALDWNGVELVEEQWVPALDGTFTRERYYRGAHWMERPSVFTLTPRNALGQRTGPSLRLKAGGDNHWRPNDDAFIRRFSARQLAVGCTQVNDCAGASFVAEALVQARSALHPQLDARRVPPATTQFDLTWSEQPAVTRSIPVELTNPESEQWSYGFEISLEDVAGPSNGQFYDVGDTVTLRLTLRDGEGVRLHPSGSLPTFGEVFSGAVDSGIRYLDPTLPTRLYYALKHRESNFMVGISGPKQNLQSPETIVDPNTFFLPQTQFAFSPVDGYTSVIQTVPSAALIFGGFQDPSLWQVPVADTVTFTIPDDALPGTYVAVVKARREFRGEALNRGASISLQVGQAAVTSFTPTTQCSSCHTGRASFDEILHGIDDRSTCFTCHSSLAIEVDNRLDFRVHRVHALSDRYPGNVNDCSTCHTTPPSGPALGL